LVFNHRIDTEKRRGKKQQTMNSEDRSSNDSGERTWIEKISQIFSSTPKTREDINDLLNFAREQAILDNDEFTIIEGAMEVTDTHVRDVMIPRSQIISVGISETPEEFLPKIIQSGHSRFPVVGETNDDVLGILHSKDLLPLVISKEEQAFDITNYLRNVSKVPESKRLNKLLKDFRENRSHMAIVIDEYGGVSGLITIEDVLEEIVGDIEDEFDVQADATIRKLSDTDYIIKAFTPIDEFNDAFKTELDQSEFDTIAGLITQQVGHVPQRNEVIDIGKYSFKVLHADKRRLHLLRLTVKSEEPEA
jgi:magnesium and cobalt transporter